MTASRPSRCSRKADARHDARSRPATVFDDGAIDQLTGSSGRDWFFESDEDQITELNETEFND